jgi:hypothetical protein
MAERAAKDVTGPTTFPLARDCAADDLHRIADIFLKAEADVRQGDISKMDYVLGNLGKWHQMLSIRHDVRMEALV